MSNYSNNLTIRLLRSPAISRSSEDDVIHVKREGGNIVVLYTDASNKNDKVKSRLVLTYTSLVDYITTLIKMVRTDCEPFESVQFNFPGFPMALYTPAKLKKASVVRTLREAARMTVDNWFHDYAGYEEDLTDDSSSTTSSSSSSSNSSSSSDDCCKGGRCNTWGPY